MLSTCVLSFSMHAYPTDAAAHPTACLPRRVYLDLGVNWGNTLRLYETIGDPSGSAHRVQAKAWHVYGFEASPRIQPFVEQFVNWLGGTTLQEPEPCVPRLELGLGLGLESTG